MTDTLVGSRGLPSTLHVRALGAPVFDYSETAVPPARQAMKRSGAVLEALRGSRQPRGKRMDGTDLHGNAIGNVYGTQGRCMMLVGLEVEGLRVERLSTGATAIYGRTDGSCPD